MRLSREIRAYLGSRASDASTRNTWAGWPGPDAFHPYLVVRAEVEGRVDAITGYVCNIAHMDHVLREHMLPILNRLYSTSKTCGEPADQTGDSEPSRDAVNMQPAGKATIETALLAGSQTLLALFHDPVILAALVVECSPHTRFTWHAETPEMVEITHAFEFSASHRLFVPALSASENRKLFGKCANVNGHGHNYVLEVGVSGRPDPKHGRVIDIDRLNDVVRRQVIDAFDHKHLNLDCPEFSDLNPTVENIARIIWEKLAIELSTPPLARVRLWETPKTWAEYRGEGR